jgi:hypothetical protein
MQIPRAQSCWLALGLLLSLSLALAATTPVDPLLDGFHRPPPEAKPQVWWHWMNGNVNLAGAKLDLEWMQRIGIGGVHTFTGGGLGEPHVIDPPVDFLSDSWQSVFRETTLQARSAGMDVTIAGSPGWSETGGIWVAPENAMKKYVWSELELRGGRRIDITLPRPPAATGPFLGVARSFNPPAAELSGDMYRDSQVIAFPTPAAELGEIAPRYLMDGAPLDLTALRGDLSSAVSLPIAEGARGVAIDAVFERPVTIAALALGLANVADLDIQAGDTAAQLRTLLHAAADPSETPAPQQTYSFQATRARLFRLILTRPAQKPLFPDLPPRLSKPRPPPSAFTLTRLDLSGGARVSRFESKAGFQASIDEHAPPTAVAASDAVIPLHAVVDLTDKLTADGGLHWNAPPGSWTLLRFGWSLTGQTNGPAQAKDTGLEVDKLDAARVREYLEHYLSIYRGAMRETKGAGSIQSLLTDSWEAGVQNWTETLFAQFQARRGYDPSPYLPVLAGRVVSDASLSERFLFDFHRTLEELLADNHYGVIAQVLHEQNLGYYTEAQGDTPRAIGDGFSIKARADIPTAEYWYRAFATAPGQPSLEADLREAASAAHIYGKPLAAAESLTVAAGMDPWAFSPAMLKPVADKIFVSGINRVLLHESHHQPLLNAAPGLTLGFFGQFFNRNDTWAEDAAPWIDYLSRSSYLLQQGVFAADVLYFYGEERNLTQLFLDRYGVEVPQGFGYDFVNAEALSTLHVAGDGTLVAPGGLHYRIVFVAPGVTHYSLPVLRQLRELTMNGAVVVAARPMGGLGVLSSDAEVAALANEIWGSAPAIGAHRLGKGRVYADTTLRAVLGAEGIAPDVAIEGCDADCPIDSLHRKTSEADIYFLVNRDAAARAARITFRVQNRVPEIWRADTATALPLDFKARAQDVTVPLKFAPHDAYFVVFRAASPATTASKPSIFVGPAHEREILRIAGPWDVNFQAGRGAPSSSHFEKLIDWRNAPDPGIKYFSGYASYHTRILVPQARAGERLSIDLGAVHELAVVSLDGVELGTAWHAPFEIDLPMALKPGSHRLDIRVDNLWVNRLIGDRQPGAVAFAFAPQSPYTADSPLVPSGLLGPVRLVAHD